MIVERGPALPPDARCYRRIGPFDAPSIPTGLLRQHDLKPGVWGLLAIETGSILFRWDDPQGGERRLAAGDTMLVPPTVPHHLEIAGPVTLSIAFHAPAAEDSPA